MKCPRSNVWTAMVIFVLGLLYMTMSWIDVLPNVNVLPLARNSTFKQAIQGVFSEVRFNVPSVSNSVGMKFSTITHDKWIVLTTIQYPTKQVEALSKLTQWKIVVVADKKTPEDWSHPNCIFLDLQTQLELGYAITEFLPYNSYTRKNIGYLFAIQHGARIIYETDDDNCPFDDLKGFRLEDEIHGLVYSARNRSTVNPYAHFGRPDIWPRGYPLEEIGASDVEHFVLSKMARPSIQQGLVNMDPDVDAIYRLTQKSHRTSIKVQFDRRLPPVVLPRQMYAPFNSQNTLWHYEAFWLMPLPVTTTFRVTDIWRGYWALRLLQEVNGTLGFYPPNANQIRNAHNYLHDFLDEAALYQDAGRLVKFLRHWICQKNSSFECLMSLTTDMAAEGFWLKQEVSLASAWVTDLQRIGFNLTNWKISRTKVPSSFSKVKSLPKVIFKPQTLKDTNRSICEEHNIIRNICRKDMPTLCGGTWPRPNVTYEHILLVIEFSQPFYSNLELMESMYRDVFPHRVYCGPWNQAQLQNVSEHVRFNYVEMTTKNGYFGYGCVLRAIEMGYSVDGYFYISDDIIMKSWHIKKLDIHKSWYLPRSPCTRNLNETKSNWVWWAGGMGRNSIIRALAEIRNLSSSDKVDGKMYAKYLYKLSNGTGDVKKVCSGTGDVFYIPSKTAKDYYKLFSIYLKYNVFLELAVPNVIFGLPENDVFHGIYEWAYNHLRCFMDYDKFTHVCHKVKLSKILREEGPRKVFCKRWVNETFTGDQISNSPSS